MLTSVTCHWFLNDSMRYIIFSIYKKDLPNNIVEWVKFKELPFCSWTYAQFTGKFSQLLLGIYYMFIVVHMARYLLLHKFFGPLVVAVVKMVKEVARFFVIFIIGIFSYGVVQEWSYITLNFKRWVWPEGVEFPLCWPPRCPARTLYFW